MPPPPSAPADSHNRDIAVPLVRVDGVSKAFRTGGATRQVLRGSSFELHPATTVSLVGVSGSGKSTLISLLAGLERADSGRILFAGADLTELDDSARADLRAHRIGIVLQNANLIPFLTSRENVELAITLADGPQRARRARALLSEVGISHRADHLPRRLSGGEAQRVAVAVALANEPSLLLADEVTGELDSAGAEELLEAIFAVSRERGVAVLFVTHSDGLAARADRCLRLVGGEVHPR